MHFVIKLPWLIRCVVCCAESSNLPRRPPLEVALAHAQELVRLMSRSGLGSCAFASVDDLLQHWLVCGEKDLCQRCRFPLNLITSTKDLVIYCLRKELSAQMKSVSAHSIGDRSTRRWKHIVQDSTLHRPFVFWLWGFELHTVCFESVRFLIIIGPVHCYVEFVRNWDTLIQCVIILLSRDQEQ